MLLTLNVKAKHGKILSPNAKPSKKLVLEVLNS